MKSHRNRRATTLLSIPVPTSVLIRLERQGTRLTLHVRLPSRPCSIVVFRNRGSRTPSDETNSILGETLDLRVTFSAGDKVIVRPSRLPRSSTRSVHENITCSSIKGSALACQLSYASPLASMS